MNILEPGGDQALIREKLLKGALLVACLCSHRCPKCESWWPMFGAVADRRKEDCFVWIEVDDHPDLVAEVPFLTRFPVLLVQSEDSIRFFAVLRDPESDLPTRRLLEEALSPDRDTFTGPDPCIREFLME